MSNVIPLDPLVTDWPLYWFARLEKAVEQGDHQAAAEAQRNLARLGVRVSYGRPRPQKEVGKKVSGKRCQDPF
jgi:hypothetical protein